MNLYLASRTPWRGRMRPSSDMKMFKRILLFLYVWILLFALPLTVKAEAGRQKPVKMQEIIKVIGANSTSVRSIGSDMSIPIPVKKAGRLLILRLIYTVRPVPNKGTIVTPPEYVATADLATGKFISLERVNPVKMGVKLNPAHQSWIRAEPDFKESRDMFAAYDRLIDLYDKLLPSFGSGIVPQDPETKQAAQEFKVLFDKLAENTLRDYYDSLGREFFDWLKNVAE